LSTQPASDSSQSRDIVGIATERSKKKQKHKKKPKTIILSKVAVAKTKTADKITENSVEEESS